jgi:hypothetical protein
MVSWPHSAPSVPPGAALEIGTMAGPLAGPAETAALIVSCAEIDGALEPAAGNQDG